MPNLDGFGSVEDIVVSTRVRIARNIDSYKFPQSMNIKEANRLNQEILGIMKGAGEAYNYFKIRDLDEMEKTSYVEDHLISPALCRATLRGSFLLREDKQVTIMLNEEDHLRIQVILAGFEMKEAWKIASSVDDFIEDKVDYAFSEKYGYLTSCPTNVGTGLRISVMLHLPAITLSKHLDEMVDILRKVGLTLRGIYGEGSKGLGCLYQISNQTTLGQSEEEIIIKLNKVVGQVIDRELGTRKFLMDYRSLDLEDKLIRSYGLIRNNRKISSQEAMTYLSDIKLGVDLGLIKDLRGQDIDRLMVDIQPGKLQCKYSKKMSRRDRDILRSKYIREFFEKEE